MGGSEEQAVGCDLIADSPLLCAHTENSCDTSRAQTNGLNSCVT